MLRTRLSRAAKVALAHLLYYSGVLRVWQSMTLRHRAVVLMYHRVLSNDERHRSGSHPGIIVTRETFARQMALLKERFTVLAADELQRHLAERRPLPHSACVITFDDGWRDNLTAALPVLRRLDLPAIVFLPVNFIGQRRLFWREALTHVLVHAVRAARAEAGCRALLEPVLAAAGFDHLLATGDADPRPAVIEAVAVASGIRASAAQRLIGAVESILEEPLDPSATPDIFLTWEEVREMAAAGVAFGGHGVEHQPLAELPSSEANEEIQGALSVVARQVGAPPLCFSYPNGSFTAQVREMVKAAGYQLAFTTQAGFVEAGDDPHTIRRVNIHEDMTSSRPMFLARVLGLF